MPGFAQEPPGFSFNSYGPGLAASVFKWMSLFKWPSLASNNTKIGISYLELSLAWMAWSGSWLPIIRYDAKKNRWASRPTRDSHAFALKVSWAEIARSFQKVIEQISHHSLGPLWPSLRPCRVTAPEKFGGPYRYRGLPLRPEFPCQAEAIQAFESCTSAMCNYQAAPVWKPIQNPNTPQWTQDDLDETPVAWLQRLNRANAHSRDVARRRRSIGRSITIGSHVHGSTPFAPAGGVLQ